MSAICDSTSEFVRLAVNKPIPTSIEGNDMYMINRFGNATSEFAKKRLTHPSGKLRTDVVSSEVFALNYTN